MSEKLTTKITPIKTKDIRYKNVGRKKKGEMSINRTYGFKPTPDLKQEVPWWDFWSGKNRTEMKRRNVRLK